MTDTLAGPSFVPSSVHSVPPLIGLPHGRTVELGGFRLSNGDGYFWKTRIISRPIWTGQPLSNYGDVATCPNLRRLYLFAGRVVEGSTSVHG